MKNLPRINQLYIFKKIIQHGSIRSAANALNQTQSALTRVINDLEKKLGTTLLVRGTRGVTLTEAGKAFEPRIELILRELQRATNEIEEMTFSSKGSIALGYTSLLPLTILSTAIQQLKSDYPNINIALMEGQHSQLLAALRSGELDFVIDVTSSNLTSREFIEEPFLTTSFCIVAHQQHPLAKSTSLSSLSKAQWYLPSSRVGYYDEIYHLLFNSTETPSVIRGNTVLTALQMVLNAGYLTIVPKEALNITNFSELLCRVPIEVEFPTAAYSFICSKQSPLTQVARQAMEELRRASINYQKGQSKSVEKKLCETMSESGK